MKKLLLSAVAALALMASPALAKEGLYVGAYFVPSADISGIGGVDTGTGYGFRAGIGVGRYFSIEGSYETTEHDIDIAGGTLDMTGLAVDAKVNFPLTSLDSGNVMTLEPYVRLGYGIDYEVETDVFEDSGSGFRIGVGIELYLFQELSINGGWTRTEISFDDSNEDGAVRVFDVGLNYHFM